MPSRAYSPQGTHLERETTPGSGEFEHISELRNIRGPNPTINDIDVTSHDSPLGTQEFRPGLINPGDLTAEMFDVPDDAAQIAMRQDFYNRATINWRLVVFSAGAEIAYFLGQGYVKTLSNQYPSDGNMAMRTLTLKLSGPWVETLGAPDFAGAVQT